MDLARHIGPSKRVDGGKSAGLAPSFSLGVLPICNSSVPPLTMSACLNQTWFSGRPLSLMLWMYLLSRELFRQMMVSAFPVSYTHLRAHETRHDLVCRLL